MSSIRISVGPVDDIPKLEDSAISLVPQDMVDGSGAEVFHVLAS